MFFQPSTRVFQKGSFSSYRQTLSLFARFYNPPQQQTQKNRKIGIIGGSGPDAGINFMQQILSVHKANKGPAYLTDKDAADVVLINDPRVGGPHGEWDLVSGKGDLVQDKHHNNLLRTMSDVIDDLKALKCDRFALVCNTLHAIEPQIRELVAQKKKENQNGHSIEFFSIIDPVKKLIVARARKNRKSGKPLRVSVYGSLLTTDLQGLSPYKRLAAVEGVEEAPFELVRHDEPQRKEMQNLIDMIKREANTNTPKYIEIFQNWMARDEADINILGCTEFSLLLDYLEEPDKCVDPVVALAVKLMEPSSQVKKVDSKVRTRKSDLRIPFSTYEDTEAREEKFLQL